MCPEHRERNKARYEERTKTCKWQFPVPPQGIHENAINHFWDQSDIIEPHSDVTPPPIDMPLSPDIRVEQTHYFENHQRIDTPLPLEVTTPGSKNLFIYESLSSSGQNIKIMADPGATISLVKENETDKIGTFQKVGTTRINGVGNHMLSTASQTVQLSLQAHFGNKWSLFQFEAAILLVITNMPQKNHT